MEPLLLIVYWLQFEWLLNYLSEHGFSLLTAAVVIAWAAISVQKLTSEHFTVLKKLGLIPSHKLTEDEKESIVISQGQLRHQFEEHRRIMNNEFVSLGRCQEIHTKTEEMFNEIMHHSKQHRKEDL